MNLVYKINKTKLEPDSIRKVGDWELFENDNGHIIVFKITGLMSSAGIVNECRNDDTLHMWSFTVPYIQWEEPPEMIDGELIDISEYDPILEDIKKTMPNPTPEQLDMLRKLEYTIVYFDGKWKRTNDISELVDYHPECKNSDGSWSIGR
jgi:hypothetical protein